jgi:hypothetical protein
MTTRRKTAMTIMRKKAMMTERETTMTRRRKTTNDDSNDKPDNKLRLKVNRKPNVGRQS